MGIEIITLLIFVSLVITITAGVPIAFSLGGVSMVFAYFFIGPQSIMLAALNVFGVMNNFMLVAIMLFIMMGVILERSGIAEDLYEAMQAWIGQLPGGLAVGTIGVSAIFATLTGISGASTVATGIFALPSMLSRGYSKFLALGSIAAGGALGILIPPSVIMLVYAVFTGQSVGRLFAAALIPGIFLSAMIVIYIIVAVILKPDLAPRKQLAKLPGSDGWSYRFRTLRKILFPVCLVIVVLGSLFTGAATPSEAGAIGVFGAMIATMLRGRVTMETIKYTSRKTLNLSCMAVWITMGALTFSAVYSAVGASALIESILIDLPGGKWTALLMMQAAFFLLGMIMDPMGILVLTMPVFYPVAMQLGFDPIWFGVLFVVNMEMAYLTPPFGFNLFYLRAIAPPEITMGDIYKSIIPFVMVQLAALILMVIFPNIILWLPNVLFSK